MGTDDLRDDNDRVYGTVWRLSKDDEERLDGFEDLGASFSKEDVFVEFWGKREGKDGKREKVDLVRRQPHKVKVMVYIDRERTADDKPTGAYRYKMNMGIRDALAEGFPEMYVERYMRPFVPLVDEQTVVTLAIEDAVKMGVDVQTILKRTEEKLAETGPKEEKEMQTSRQTMGKYLEKIVAETGDGVEKSGMVSVRGRATSSAW